MGTRLFISIRPDRRGGGSTTFAWNAARWARRRGYRVVDTIDNADVAIIIAHCGATEADLAQAQTRGCFILHRIDEHFNGPLGDAYRKKHEQIHRLNQFADITVFQSRFVEQTAQPILQHPRHVVILNGADPSRFRPARRAGTVIGHVTWGLIAKKRIDRVHETILQHPDETFHLIGPHAEHPELDFHLPNARLRGKRSRRQLPSEYRKMKLLFFPSENDPCPNTVIEAILSGVPVCYHASGGTPELVRECGEPLDKLDKLLRGLPAYRARCLQRHDLHFETMMQQYESLWLNRSCRQRTDDA